MATKKVLLLVVDALSSRAFFPALEADHLPNFKRLASTGLVREECCAIFPSITHAALSSMVTGRYPASHGIPGSHWFDRATNNLVHYAGDFQVAWNEGVLDSLLDLLVRLNHEQLQGDTLFDLVEDAGYTACCINHIVHRGRVRHQVDKPLLLDVLPRVGDVEYINGPTQLYMGALTYSCVNDHDSFPPADAGLMRRYGLDDEYTGDTLLYLARHDALPEMTVAYFMDNDFASHKNGPHSAINVLKQVDDYLGQLIQVGGGLESLLEEFTILVTGDHAQADILGEEEIAAINLDAYLAPFAVAKMGQPWQEDEEIVVCPNMSTVQFYFRRHDGERLQERIDHIGDLLLTDKRVDQMIWRTSDVDRDGVGYRIRTEGGHSLHFWPASVSSEPNASYASDEWGCRWGWRGDLRCVDGSVDEKGTLCFGDYPNAFERIAGLLDSQTAGQLWVTAHPGYEFRWQGSMVHNGGGAHGSLHAAESLVPLLAAGMPSTIDLPPSMRTVDITPLCLTLLGLDPHPKMGATHIGR